jgi:pectinesterase
MGEHIHPNGWKEWHTGGETYYAEYESIGPGGLSSERVDWSFQLSNEQANNYTIKNIFKDWVPDSD